MSSALLQRRVEYRRNLRALLSQAALAKSQMNPMVDAEDRIKMFCISVVFHIIRLPRRQEIDRIAVIFVEEEKTQRE